jgi:hypothetical protein
MKIFIPPNPTVKLTCMHYPLTGPTHSYAPLQLIPGSFWNARSSVMVLGHWSWRLACVCGLMVMKCFEKCIDSQTVCHCYVCWVCWWGESALKSVRVSDVFSVTKCVSVLRECVSALCVSVLSGMNVLHQANKPDPNLRRTRTSHFMTCPEIKLWRILFKSQHDLVRSSKKHFS